MSPRSELRLTIGAEAGVNAQNALLASIVDSSEDAIMSKSPDGAVTTWNRGAESMFGYTASEMIGKQVQLLSHVDRQAEMDSVMARIRNGERVEHHETVRVRKDGSTIAISLTVSAILDGTGMLVGISSIARDISERKRKEGSVYKASTAQAAKELELSVELRRFKTLTVGRELKMIELKRELEELKQELASLKAVPAAPRLAGG